MERERFLEIVTSELPLVERRGFDREVKVMDEATILRRAQDFIKSTKQLLLPAEEPPGALTDEEERERNEARKASEHHLLRRADKLFDAFEAKANMEQIIPGKLLADCTTSILHNPVRRLRRRLIQLREPAGTDIDRQGLLPKRCHTTIVTSFFRSGYEDVIEGVWQPICGADSLDIITELEIEGIEQTDIKLYKSLQILERLIWISPANDFLSNYGIHLSERTLEEARFHRIEKDWLEQHLGMHASLHHLSRQLAITA